MNKSLILMGLFSVFLFAIFAPSVSAYYGDDYSNTYYEKSSYGYDGYQYTQKSVQKDPWGEKTTYVKVKNYDNYDRYPYSNVVTNYWGYDSRYSQPRHLGNYWNDARNRDYYGSQYHDYYYKPDYYYNGNYYNWHGSNDCRSSYCRW